MDVQGVLGSISFDGEWITITKKRPGEQGVDTRIRATDITGTRFKQATRWVYGYVQFVIPGGIPAPERKGGLSGGRPPYEDPHSLSIPRRSNEATEKLLAAIEQARSSR